MARWALSRLAAEIRHKLKREPDSGDLLLILASAPATPVAQILGELGVGVDALPGVLSASAPKRWPKTNSPSKSNS